MAIPTTPEETILLNDPYIEDPEQVLGEYRFYLAKISGVRITIRLVKHLNAGNVWFEQSHFIHTPLQADPYRTSRPWDDDEAAALRAALRTFTSDYDSAVQQGHAPAESWLVSNPHFYHA